MLQDEQQRLMPNPGRLTATSRCWRVSSTALVHLQRNRYSVPTEHAHEVVSLRLYPERACGGRELPASPVMCAASSVARPSTTGATT